MAEDLNIDLSAKLPGESMIVAVMESITKISTTNRETMSQANRDRLDVVSIGFLEDVQKIGRKFWKSVKLLD